MLCKECNVPMDKGFLNKVYLWRKGERKTSKMFRGMISKMFDIKGDSIFEDAFINEKIEILVAYRCPKCKKVVLYIEEMD